MSVPSSTLDQVKLLAGRGNVRVSQHGYGRIIGRQITVTEIMNGVDRGEALEDYPDYVLGPAVLVLQLDANGQPLHVVWGIEAGTTEPAVIVTAYRPKPADWSNDFRRRKP